MEPPSYIARCAGSGDGARNVVLVGGGTRASCHFSKCSDPLSIKTALQGEVEWRLENRPYLIQPDTLLLLPDREEYSLTIDDAQATRGFNVLFRRGLVEDCWRTAVSSAETLLEAPEELRPLPFRRRLEARTGPLGQALEALAGAVAARAPASAVETLFELLGERAAQSVCEERREQRRLPAVRPATRAEIHRRLGLAREAVEDELSASWTLVTMARRATMAPHHFHRCFHQVFGETPRGWLARRRAERAMALLRGTTRPVIEVCLAVGYESASSFSASFAARYGVPPSRVRRAQRPAPPGSSLRSEAFGYQ